MSEINALVLSSARIFNSTWVRKNAKSGNSDRHVFRSTRFRKSSNRTIGDLSPISTTIVNLDIVAGASDTWSRMSGDETCTFPECKACVRTRADATALPSNQLARLMIQYGYRGGYRQRMARVVRGRDESRPCILREDLPPLIDCDLFHRASSSQNGREP